MSFLRSIADAYRAMNEGRTTAKAHLMAEEFLNDKLPRDVAAAGYSTVSSMAEFLSVEEMAMIYVVEYATAMERQLTEIGAAQDLKMRVSSNVARACIRFARLQRSGTHFNSIWVNSLVRAANKLGVDTNSSEIAFSV